MYVDDFGDIVMERSNVAQIVFIPEIESKIFSITHIKNIPVTITSINISELMTRREIVKEITTVEASLRLDAIASAGFGISRSKMVEIIEKDQVLLDWKITKKITTVKVNII